MGNKMAGAAFVTLIVVVVAVSFGYILSSPTSSGLTPTTSDYSSATNSYYVHLYADAAGWDEYYNALNSSQPLNPTIFVKVDTTIYFNVTEEDGAPHTLTIGYLGATNSSANIPIQNGNISNSAMLANYKAYEPGNGYTVLSQAQITTTIGHTTQGKFPFTKPGIYSYWCIVHPFAMLGVIVVGSYQSPPNLEVGHQAPMVSQVGSELVAQFGNLYMSNIHTGIGTEVANIGV